MPEAKETVSVGQVDKQNFVHRVYEESHVRVCLISFSYPVEPDKIAGTRVETRIGDPTKDICKYESQVFGVTLKQFLNASEVFREKVLSFLGVGDAAYEEGRASKVDEIRAALERR